MGKINFDWGRKKTIISLKNKTGIRAGHYMHRPDCMEQKGSLCQKGLAQSKIQLNPCF